MSLPEEAIAVRGTVFHRFDSPPTEHDARIWTDALVSRPTLASFSQHVTLKGFIHKRGPTSRNFLNWKRMFFLLQYPLIVYFPQNEPGTKCEGVIYVGPPCGLRPLPYYPGSMKHVLKIIPCVRRNLHHAAVADDEHNFYLSFETRSQMETWVTTLEQEIQAAALRAEETLMADLLGPRGNNDDDGGLGVAGGAGGGGPMRLADVSFYEAQDVLRRFEQDAEQGAEEGWERDGDDPREGRPGEEEEDEWAAVRRSRAASSSTSRPPLHGARAGGVQTLLDELEMDESPPPPAAAAAPPVESVAAVKTKNPILLRLLAEKNQKSGMENGANSSQTVPVNNEELQRQQEVRGETHAAKRVGWSSASPLDEPSESNVNNMNRSSPPSAPSAAPVTSTNPQIVNPNNEVKYGDALPTLPLTPTHNRVEDEEPQVELSLSPLRDPPGLFPALSTGETTTTIGSASLLVRHRHVDPSTTPADFATPHGDSNVLDEGRTPPLDTDGSPLLLSPSPRSEPEEERHLTATNKQIDKTFLPPQDEVEDETRNINGAALIDLDDVLSARTSQSSQDDEGAQSRASSSHSSGTTVFSALFGKKKLLPPHLRRRCFFQPKDAVQCVNSEHVHPLRCSRCRITPVVGFLYSCVVCPHTDLCASCFRVEDHDPRHLFLVSPEADGEMIRVAPSLEMPDGFGCVELIVLEGLFRLIGGVMDGCSTVAIAKSRFLHFWNSTMAPSTRTAGPVISSEHGTSFDIATASTTTTSSTTWVGLSSCHFSLTERDLLLLCRDTDSIRFSEFVFLLRCKLGSRGAMYWMTHAEKGEAEAERFLIQELTNQQQGGGGERLRRHPTGWREEVFDTLSAMVHCYRQQSSKVSSNMGDHHDEDDVSQMYGAAVGSSSTSSPHVSAKGLLGVLEMRRKIRNASMANTTPFSPLQSSCLQLLLSSCASVKRRRSRGKRSSSRMSNDDDAAAAEYASAGRRPLQDEEEEEDEVVPVSVLRALVEKTLFVQGAITSDSLESAVGKAVDAALVLHATAVMQQPTTTKSLREDPTPVDAAAAARKLKRLLNMLRDEDELISVNLVSRMLRSQWSDYIRALPPAGSGPLDSDGDEESASSKFLSAVNAVLTFDLHEGLGLFSDQLESMHAVACDSCGTVPVVGFLYECQTCAGIATPSTAGYLHAPNSKKGGGSMDKMNRNSSNLSIASTTLGSTGTQQRRVGGGGGDNREEQEGRHFCSSCVLSGKAAQKCLHVTAVPMQSASAAGGPTKGERKSSTHVLKRLPGGTLSNVTLASSGP